MISPIILSAMLWGSEGPCKNLDACSSALLRRGGEWKFVATQCDVLLAEERRINDILSNNPPPAIEQPASHSIGLAVAALSSGVLIGFFLGRAISSR